MTSQASASTAITPTPRPNLMDDLAKCWPVRVSIKVTTTIIRPALYLAQYWPFRLVAKPISNATEFAYHIAGVASTVALLGTALTVNHFFGRRSN